MAFDSCRRVTVIMMIMMMLASMINIICAADSASHSFLSTKSIKASHYGGIISAFTASPLAARRTIHKKTPSHFPQTIQKKKQRISFLPIQSTATDETTSAQQQQQYSQYKPRQGLAQSILNLMLSSPLWKYILVPQARNTMVKTAEANGIPWKTCLQWLQNQDGPWKEKKNNLEKELDRYKYPEYYKKSFHAYDSGNLSWDAALEQEIASCSVGARNFPMYGYRGEEMFRSSFDVALEKLGATVPSSSSKGITTILDLGCGTGTSTRRLAKLFPQAKVVMGMDLSPYMVGVGKKLLDLAPRCIMEEEEEEESNGGAWVNTITPDERITLQVGDAADTKLPDQSVDVVNLGLVIHELPSSVAADVVQEAHRILKPGGQLWISEMDFESPAYAKQRSNALLFSLLRATEPYLDEYADGFQQFLYEVVAKEFDVVRIGAATGRHYSMVAIKESGGKKKKKKKGDVAVVEDSRFLEDGSYALDDTHLNLWESKKMED